MRVRGVLFQIHLWTGLVLCAPLVVIGLTGSVLVFHHELNDILLPKMPIASLGEAKSPGALLEAAAAVAPRELRATFVSIDEEQGKPARVRFQMPGQQPGPGATGLQVFLDPSTASVIGTYERLGMVEPLSTLHRLHGNFLIAGRDGRELVGWFGVAMLGLGMTGLVLWWPKAGKWRQAFLVKRGARGLRLHRDLHGAAGIWMWLVFVVVSFTGVFIAFPQTVTAGIHMVFPGRDLRATANAIKVKPIEVGSSMALDDAVAIAAAAVPGTRFYFAQLPQKSDQPLRIALIGPDYRHGQPFVTAFIDPWTAQIIELRDPRQFTAGETIQAWQRALHEGEGAGWIYKILVFFSGLLPLLFSATGATMWVLKRRAKRPATRVLDVLAG